MVSLRCHPAGRSRVEAFYAGVLGVPRVAKPPHLERRGGRWFRSDEVEIYVGTEQPFTPARKAHSAFPVDDLAGLRERMTTAGAPVVLDEPLPGYDRFYTSDPFGNRNDVSCPVAPPWSLAGWPSYVSAGS
jgi:catechol 2,3-dioxygenase-like lactoylglutathione lyase family enzyme